jgi:hypothetical protein
MLHVLKLQKNTLLKSHMSNKQRCHVILTGQGVLSLRNLSAAVKYVSFILAVKCKRHEDAVCRHLLLVLREMSER